MHVYHDLRWFRDRKLERFWNGFAADLETVASAPKRPIWRWKRRCLTSQGCVLLGFLDAVCLIASQWRYLSWFIVLYFQCSIRHLALSIRGDRESSAIMDKDHVRTRSFQGVTERDNT